MLEMLGIAVFIRGIISDRLHIAAGYLPGKFFGGNYNIPGV
jgi:hypothetical protein